MAANIPFTPSTIAYDPPRQYVLGVIPSPGSVLDVVFKQFDQTAALINRANYQKLYTTASPVTLFVSRSFVYDPNTPISEALQMCKSLTVPRMIDHAALVYSPTYLLRTLATPFDLLIRRVHDVITVNSIPIVESIMCTNGFIYVLV